MLVRLISAFVGFSVLVGCVGSHEPSVESSEQGMWVSEETADVELGDYVKDGAIAAAEQLFKIMSGEQSCNDALATAMLAIASLSNNVNHACVGMGGVKLEALKELIRLAGVLAGYQLQLNQYGYSGKVCAAIDMSRGRPTTMDQLTWNIMETIAAMHRLLSNPQELCSEPPQQLWMCDCDITCRQNTLDESGLEKRIRGVKLLELPAAEPPRSCDAWAPTQCQMPYDLASWNCKRSHVLAPGYTPDDTAEIVKGIKEGVNICRDKGTFDMASVCNGGGIGGGGQEKCWAACGLTPEQFLHQGMNNACNKQCYETVGRNCAAGTCNGLAR